MLELEPVRSRCSTDLMDVGSGVPDSTADSENNAGTLYSCGTLSIEGQPRTIMDHYWVAWCLEGCDRTCVSLEKVIDISVSRSECHVHMNGS